MLKRKSFDSIGQWLRRKNKKCLIIQGARQVGKTYIVERFADSNIGEDEAGILTLPLYMSAFI